MYCITLNDDHYDKIKTLGYIPVGLGKDITTKEFLTDNTGKNITTKNPHYGEYTFHYWIWKNKLNHLTNNWIGFCQYRKYWSIEKQKNNYTNLSEFGQNLIKEIPKKYDAYESILGEPLFINKFKLAKFLKKNLFNIIKNPKILYNKGSRNIKFHFDLMHGNGNLDKAISLLDQIDRKDFNDFVNSEVSFNPHNMFICKSNETLKKYYESIFPWLERCEKKFGFELDGYGLKRIYGFLAERYMSFWFKKYTKFSTMPIIFKDISLLD